MPGQIATDLRTFWVLRGTRMIVNPADAITPATMTDMFYSTLEGFTENIGEATIFSTEKEAKAAMPTVYRSDETWVRVWPVRALCRLKEYK